MAARAPTLSVASSPETRHGGILAAAGEQGQFSETALRNRYRRAVDLDLQNVTWDPVLLSLAAFLAVCAIYLLFLRNAVMWGFLCILGIVGLFVVMVSPDMLNNR